MKHSRLPLAHITLLMLSLFVFTAVLNAQTFTFGSKTNPQGVTFEVDANGFVIGGKHVLPVMGEIHFSRVPANEWRHELQKMKAGGITIVATYVFWSHHEYVEGQWDWKGNKDLHAFLEACKMEQMPVILRLGPFCHGEVLMGGIPAWVVGKSQADPANYKLRSLAPGFMKSVETLYAKIYEQSSDMLWKDGGPVVGVQLENECRGPWAYYMSLKDIAVRIGFDTPFYTRTGWPKLNGKEEFGQMLPLYGDYADGFWDRKLTDMPGEYAKAFEMKDERMSRVIATETFSADDLSGSDNANTAVQSYPYLTCELGGGMMPSYHRRINMTGNEPFPLAICKLGSGSNMPGYYMYHGGTNPDAVVMPDGTLQTMGETQASPVTNYNDMPYKTYDFQCPLGEMGQPNLTAFHQTRWLHQFLSQWGEQLSQMPVDTLSQHYARRGCFEFYNDYVRIHNEGGRSYVRPVGMPFCGHTISATAQPFFHIGNTLYLIGIKDMTPTVIIDGKTLTLKADKTIRFKDVSVCLLSPEKARRAYVIDGKLHYAQHDGGILYKDAGIIKEEYWQATPDQRIKYRKVKDADAPRTITLGVQKVAAMPSDSDFDHAAIYELSLDGIAPNGAFLQITYEGDCARLYADGKLVQDNFWNGKPMLVRLSDLVGKHVELRILPLRKDAPIYLQKQQRDILDNAPGDALLNLRDIQLLQRHIVTPQQRSMSLAGEWQFMIDRNDEGQKAGWYNADHPYDDTILLPGSMPERMKGDDITVNTQWTGGLYDSSYYRNPYMEKYRVEGNVKVPFFLTPCKYYVGKSWYRRTVHLDKSWFTPSVGGRKTQKKQYELFLERPHIATTLWVNGKRIATNCPSSAGTGINTLSMPHIYYIDEADLHEGDNVIAICVDNRLDVANVGKDSHSVTDQTQGNWNGITGRMLLRERSIVDTLKVYPDVDNKRARVHLALNTKGLTGKADITLKAESYNSMTRHAVKPQTMTVDLDRDSIFDANISMGDDMLLWDEHHPNMYSLTVDVRTQGRNSVSQTYFGMRKMEIRDKAFYLNDKPVQLRGTVENCCFPLTGYPPTDLDSWIKIFNTCKQWGLNHMRFHSYCPPEAAFLAADMTGFYIQPEGPSWPNHGVKLGRGEFIDNYLYDEAVRIMDTYGNHPSFTFFAFGNEPAGNWVKWSNDMTPKIAHYDPRHLNSGFSVGGGWAWQPKVEYAVKAGARGLDSWNRTAPESTENFYEKVHTYNGKDMSGTKITIPFVSHETGQWCAFPNLEETTKYTGVNKAYNFDIFRDLLRDNGMEQMAPKFLYASGKLQALCYKYEIERHLRTPDYAGFQLLSLNDYSGQGTALVGVTDVFWDSKGYVSAPEWREFCSDIVPLAAIKKFTYTNDETFTADLQLSHFPAQASKDAIVQWQVTSGDSAIASGSFHHDLLPIAQNIDIGAVNVPLSGIREATKCTLSVSVQGTSARNHWDFWVYPSSLDTDADDILITDTLDSKALKTLARGGKVLLCAAGKVTYGREVKQQFTPVFWNTSWFKMRPPHTTGIYVENTHPVFTLFPTDCHSDLQWWELVNKAQVMQFTDFPRDFQPLVQSIDTWFVSRKIGMLFEANVQVPGSRKVGRLMMTTMDLTSNLAHRHAARQMRYSILTYMQSPSFAPHWNIPLQTIQDLFTKVAGEVNMYTNDSPDELKPKLK